MSERLPEIPDKILEACTCKKCDKYLTVGPITVHPDGGNICGRCHQAGVDKSNILFECGSEFDLTQAENIPYTIFAYSNHLFPCINRYEGCSKLLKFEDVGEHESICRSRKNQCYLCKYEGTGSQLINHFQKYHPRNVFDKIKFTFPLISSNFANLIKRDEEIFFLNIEIFQELKEVNFFVKSTRDLNNNIDFFCLLKDLYGEVIDQTIVIRRTKSAILHQIILRKDLFNKPDSFIYCDCLLRQVECSNKII